MSKIIPILLTATLISTPYINRDKQNYIKDINEMVVTNNINSSRLERLNIDLKDINDLKLSYFEVILKKLRLQEYVETVNRNIQKKVQEQEKEYKNVNQNSAEILKKQEFNLKYLRYIGNRRKAEVVELLQLLKSNNNNVAYNLQKQQNQDIPKILIQFKDIVVETDFDDKKYDLYMSQALSEVEDKIYTVGISEKNGYISEIYIFEVKSLNNASDNKNKNN